MEECEGVDLATFRNTWVPAYRPVVLRGLVRDWPVVAAAARSDRDAATYLAGFDRGAQVDAFVGSPEIDGRFFYRGDMAGFNFERRSGPFRDVLRDIVALAEQQDAPAVYIGSAPIPEVLPGFAAHNPMPLLDETIAVPRIWIGNRSVVSTHFDLSDNIACVVAGRRRFTLFPPEQLPNLYVGPLDHTMAGQPASMVELNAPDFERYPALSRCTRGGGHRRARTGRRDLHPDPLVAPDRNTVALQHPDQLLVGGCAAGPWLDV